MPGPDQDVEVADGTDVRPIGRWGLGWRVLAAVALVVLLVHGSASDRVKDDAWPLGPLSQYAFRPGPDDTVVITRTYGVLPGGTRVELPLRAAESGIRRADVEARIPDIERDPSLLRAVSDGWASLNPGRPRPVEVLLVQERTHLHEGKPVSTDEVPLARWVVTP